MVYCQIYFLIDLFGDEIIMRSLIDETPPFGMSSQIEAWLASHSSM